MRQARTDAERFLGRYFMQPVQMATGYGNNDVMIVILGIVQDFLPDGPELRRIAIHAAALRLQAELHVHQVPDGFLRRPLDCKLPGSAAVLQVQLVEAMFRTAEAEFDWF